MKALLAFALAIALPAHADSIRITAGGALHKYNGHVQEILPPTDTAPATMYFTESTALPIGGGPGTPVVGQPWRVVFTRADGGVVDLVCVGTTPGFDGVAFYFRVQCTAAPMGPR